MLTRRQAIFPHWEKGRTPERGSLTASSLPVEPPDDPVLERSNLSGEPSTHGVSRRLILRAAAGGATVLGLFALADVAGFFSNLQNRMVINEIGKLHVDMLTADRDNPPPTEFLENVATYLKDLPKRVYQPDGNDRLQVVWVGNQDPKSYQYDGSGQELGNYMVFLGQEDLNRMKAADIKTRKEVFGDFTERVLEVSLRRFPEARNDSRYWEEQLNNIVTSKYDFVIPNQAFKDISLMIRANLEARLAAISKNKDPKSFLLFDESSIQQVARTNEDISMQYQLFCALGSDSDPVRGIGFIAFLGKLHVMGSNTLDKVLRLNALTYAPELIDPLKFLVTSQIFGGRLY